MTTVSILITLSPLCLHRLYGNCFQTHYPQSAVSPPVVWQLFPYSLPSVRCVSTGCMATVSILITLSPLCLHRLYGNCFHTHYPQSAVSPPVAWQLFPYSLPSVRCVSSGCMATVSLLITLSPLCLHRLYGNSFHTHYPQSAVSPPVVWQLFPYSLLSVRCVTTGCMATLSNVVNYSDSMYSSFFRHFLSVTSLLN
jgi:hypothetical protein